MASTRVAKVSRQVLHELSEIIERDLKDPRVGMVTLTAVQMTSDLRSARIYFSRMGTLDEREGSRKALEHASGFLRRELGERLRLRYLPELRFFVDDTLDVAEKISRILAKEKRIEAESEDGG